MLRHYIFGFALLGVGSFVVGCSDASSASNDLYPTTGEDTADADQTLSDLGIDPATEEIASDFDDADVVDVESPESFPQALTDDEDDLSDSIAADQMSFSSLNPSWWNKKYECADPRGSSCVCRGSLYNCQSPNKQPGRSRLLTQKQMDELAQTKNKADRLKIVTAADWAVSGSPPLYDGEGVVRGKVTDGHLRLNYGVEKTVKDKQTGKSVFCLYAFDATITGGLHVSGWVPASALNAHAAVKAVADPAGTLSGHKLSFKQASDYRANGKPCAAATFSPQACLPKSAELKVVPNATEAHEKMGDYLLKEGNVINIIYSTPRMGGAATDTIIMTPDLTFERVKSTKDHATALRIHLYPKGSTKSAGVADFLYGKVAGKYGWVAAKALKPFAAAKAADTAGGCFGKTDGVIYCDPSSPTHAFSCTNDTFTNIDACAPSEHCVTDASGKATLDASGNVVCAE